MSGCPGPRWSRCSAAVTGHGAHLGTPVVGQAGKAMWEEHALVMWLVDAGHWIWIQNIYGYLWYSCMIALSFSGSNIQRSDQIQNVVPIFQSC